jgi:hypothetical protein
MFGSILDFWKVQITIKQLKVQKLERDVDLEACKERCDIKYS